MTHSIEGEDPDTWTKNDPAYDSNCIMTTHANDLLIVCGDYELIMSTFKRKCHDTNIKIDIYSHLSLKRERKLIMQDENQHLKTCKTKSAPLFYILMREKSVLN